MSFEPPSSNETMWSISRVRPPQEVQPQPQRSTMPSSPACPLSRTAGCPQYADALEASSPTRGALSLERGTPKGRRKPGRAASSIARFRTQDLGIAASVCVPDHRLREDATGHSGASFIPPGAHGGDRAAVLPSPPPTGMGSSSSIAAAIRLSSACRRATTGLANNQRDRLGIHEGAITPPTTTRSSKHR